MGKFNFNPARVATRASRMLELKAKQADSGMMPDFPAWYNAVQMIPPSEILTRPLPVQHEEVVHNPKLKKASKMFKPAKIVYPEDRIRKAFYKDHPWELARPRMVLEQDGKDGQKYDWSKIEQRGRELNGESVVQRQLWLLQNVPGMTSSKAYDQARKEFYASRHQEDIERRVAKEEALAVGAYFGLSQLEVGMKLEDEMYEGWKAWAAGEVQTQQMASSASAANLASLGAEDEIVDASPI